MRCNDAFFAWRCSLFNARTVLIKGREKMGDRATAENIWCEKNPWLQLQAVKSVTMPIRANMARRVLGATSLLFLSRERIFILALRPGRCKFAKDRGWVIR
jgi:hypothetical protein